MDNLIVILIIAVVYGIAALLKRLGQTGQEQRSEEEPQEPSGPAPSGLEDIRRFLEEVGGGPADRVPPSRQAPTQPRPGMPSAPTLRAPGRPPTRRRAAAGGPPTRVPTQRPAPARPTAAPQRVTVQPPAPAAMSTRPLTGRLSEAKVRETLRAGEVAAKAESLAQQAERLAAGPPRQVVSVAPRAQAEAYELVSRAPAQGLLEAVQRLRQPLAQAILYQEIIGLPLALRSPERTFTDRSP